MVSPPRVLQSSFFLFYCSIFSAIITISMMCVYEPAYIVWKRAYNINRAFLFLYLTLIIYLALIKSLCLNLIRTLAHGLIHYFHCCHVLRASFFLYCTASPNVHYQFSSVFVSPRLRFKTLATTSLFIAVFSCLNDSFICIT